MSEQYAPFALIAPVVVLVFIIAVFMIAKKLRGGKRTSSPNDIPGEEPLTAMDLWLEMARSYEKSGDIEKALEHYELYIFKKRPNDPEIYFHVGNLFGKESLKEATVYWQQAADMGYQPAIELLEEFEVTE